MSLVRSTPATEHEAELRERDELHRLACEAGRTGSWYVSLDTQAMTLSPMAASLLGLPAQEICLPAEIWRSRVDSTHLRGLEGAVRNAAKDAKPFDFEFKASTPDGTEYWLYVRGGVVRNSDGVPVRVHGGIVDLSGHRRDQDELKRLNETLEQRVTERSRELLDALEALRQSQKLEAMGQLTGGIAHDFNNLLTPIMANLDLLRPNIQGEREQRLVDGALKSAKSAQVLVQRLLAFARRQALQPDRVDVRALIEDMASDLIARTLGPQMRIVVDVAADLEPALADPNQLEMAILNLSVNARDAMPGGGTLTIRAVNEEVGARHEAKLAPGSYVRLTIVDTGIGMDEMVCERAIEPFFSTKGVGKGTGLGLSTVDGLASQMGGAFRLSSAPGIGTRARLWLPAWRGPDEKEKAVPPPPPKGQSVGLALVVDDHELVRVTTAELMTELGYEVIQARSAEEAAELIGRGLHIDLIVTDQIMPGMSGVDLARIVRTRSPRTLVLLVTGFSDPKGVPPDLVCLHKPFRKADLVEHIARLRRLREGS